MCGGRVKRNHATQSSPRATQCRGIDSVLVSYHSSTSVRLNACIKLEQWHGKLLTSNVTINCEGVSAMSNEQ